MFSEAVAAFIELDADVRLGPDDIVRHSYTRTRDRARSGCGGRNDP